MLVPLLIIINFSSVVHIKAINQQSVQPNTSTLIVSKQFRISPNDILQNLINSSYDRRIRPPNIDDQGLNQPVVVEANAYIRSFSSIDFVKMQYNVQLTFRQSWKDSRLAYQYRGESVPKFIIITRDDLIWKPDTFFINEKQAFRHNVDSPNMLFRIHSDGTVLYSQRISLTLSCPMVMKKYPMDKQNCDISFASYAYATEEIVYYWRKDEPIQLHRDLPNSLPCFTLDKFDTDICSSKTNTGVYSCLKVTFFLHRQFSYYMLQVYIPSTLLVIVSWISFWLDRTAVPARVTLGVTSLLTMTTQAASIQSSLPAVSYVKAIDIWLGSCMSFIFAAVLEFAWVSIAASTQERRENQIKSCLQHSQLNSPDSGLHWPSKSPSQEEDKLLNVPDKNQAQVPSQQEHADDESKAIDLRARKLFPAMFLCFQCAYWIWYSTLD